MWHRFVHPINNKVGALGALHYVGWCVGIMVCPMLICGLYFVLIHGIPGCTFAKTLSMILNHITAEILAVIIPFAAELKFPIAEGFHDRKLKIQPTKTWY
jgi:hypothetical protein